MTIDMFQFLQLQSILCFLDCDLPHLVYHRVCTYMTITTGGTYDTGSDYLSSTPEIILFFQVEIVFLSLSLCNLSFRRSSSAMVLSICFRLMNMNVPLVMFATLLQTYVLVLFVISNFGEFGLKQLNTSLCYLYLLESIRITTNTLYLPVNLAKNFPQSEPVQCSTILFSALYFKSNL